MRQKTQRSTGIVKDEQNTKWSKNGFSDKEKKCTAIISSWKNLMQRTWFYNVDNIIGKVYEKHKIFKDNKSYKETAAINQKDIASLGHIYFIVFKYL